MAAECALSCPSAENQAPCPLASRSRCQTCANNAPWQSQDSSRLVLFCLVSELGRIDSLYRVRAKKSKMSLNSAEACKASWAGGDPFPAKGPLQDRSPEQRQRGFSVVWAFLISRTHTGPATWRVPYRILRCPRFVCAFEGDVHRRYLSPVDRRVRLLRIATGGAQSP